MSWTVPCYQFILYCPCQTKAYFFENFRIFLSPRKKLERESNYKIFQMYCYTISIRILFPFFIVTFLPYKQNCIKQYLQAIAHCLKFICFRPGMFTFPVLFIEKKFWRRNYLNNFYNGRGNTNIWGFWHSINLFFSVTLCDLYDRSTAECVAMILCMTKFSKKLWSFDRLIGIYSYGHKSIVFWSIE